MYHSFNEHCRGGLNIVGLPRLYVIKVSWWLAEGRSEGVMSKSHRGNETPKTVRLPPAAPEGATDPPTQTFPNIITLATCSINTLVCSPCFISFVTLQVLSAATVVAKHTSALCNTCRMASQRTGNPVAKRHFVQSAKDVANNTANLVRAIKVLSPASSVFLHVMR